MREIKFRAWSFTNKKMLDRVLAGPGDPCSIVWRDESEEWVNFDDACGVIMQYTGLKDKNGKEIYEGDIIEYLDNTSQGFVKKTATITDIRSLPDFGCSKWEEIIGNIYENPERVEAQ